MEFAKKHLLGIESLSPSAICQILDLADSYVDLNRQSNKHSSVLAGLTQINMFFENSTRTQASFEIAGKRLGADVMNMKMQASSIKKGETLIDTALTNTDSEKFCKSVYVITNLMYLPSSDSVTVKVEFVAPDISVHDELSEEDCHL